MASQLRRTKASNVVTWLRRIPRLQSYAAVLASAICAMVVAAEMGENAGDGDVSRVLWAFRLSVHVFVAWCGWGLVACAWRWLAHWRPKGMEREVVGWRRPLRTRGYPVRRWRRRGPVFCHSALQRLRPLFRSRRPDVVFDLTDAALVSAAPTPVPGRGTQR